MSNLSGRFFANGEAAAVPERSGLQRRWWRWAAWLVVGLALAGHVAYHYVPRERAGRPGAGDLPAHLLAAGEYEARIWIPHPHQNLAVLAAAVDDPEAYLAAAGRAGGVPPPVLRSFGPFPAPPARELTMAADLGGERFAAVARVYPLIAGLARLAGWVAGNPWLSGGEVLVGEATVRVRWQGTLWIVEPLDQVLLVTAPSEREDVSAGSAGPATPGAALARFALERQVGVLPPGAYRFQRIPQGLAVLGEGATARQSEAWSSWLSTPLAAVAQEAGRPSIVVFETGREGGSPRAAALYGDRIDKLPRAAVVSRPGFDRWRLPGEELLSMVGKDLPQAESGGWHVLTYDRATLSAALDLPVLVEAGSRQGLAYGLWVRPGSARRTVDGVAALLDSIPLLGRRHARRWQDWSRLLAPLDRFERIVAEVGREAAEVQVFFLESSGNSLVD